ncbi:hypothetical protein SK128_010277 [Halocaridina rubra]|uniref:Uncharacterized protein n=1 Tax=Halocaridina rubra TaxID=373956 RepID=A0AAN8XUV3_HALRR
MEKVLKHDMKLVPEIRNLSYDERLRELDLSSLEARRIKGDMIFNMLCPCCSTVLPNTSRFNSLGTSRGKDGGSFRSLPPDNSHPVVLYTKAQEEQTCNGISIELQDQEVTFVSQVVTTTTL